MPIIIALLIFGTAVREWRHPLRRWWLVVLLVLAGIMAIYTGVVAFMAGTPS